MLNTSPTPPSGLDTLTSDGCMLLPRMLPLHSIDRLATEADRVFADGQDSSRRRAGVRGAVQASSLFASTVAAEGVFSVARAVLGESAFLVRSILFDKSPQNNWDVPWHRDTTIAVRTRRESPGFGPWSVKEGIPHVQPPLDVLAQMITLRLHIDACPAANGALMVVPGSHQPSSLSADGVDSAWCDANSRVCEIEAGGCLVMRPLILHASRKSEHPTRRRVLHLEFAAAPLPHGLEWARL